MAKSKKKAGKKKATSKKKSKGIASAKAKKEKKPREKSDGKRQTIWMSESLRKRVEKAFPKQSFSHSVAEGLELLLKKAK